MTNEDAKLVIAAKKALEAAEEAASNGKPVQLNKAAVGALVAAFDALERDRTRLHTIIRYRRMEEESRPY